MSKSAHAHALIFSNFLKIRFILVAGDNLMESQFQALMGVNSSSKTISTTGETYRELMPAETSLVYSLLRNQSVLVRDIEMKFTS